MQVFPNHLARELGEELRLVYVVCGDEYVLQASARDAILNSAKEKGIESVTVHHASDVRNQSKKGEVWYRLLDELEEESLFGSRQVVEVRSTAKLFASSGWTVVQDYINKPSEQNVLLLWISDLSTSQRRSSWFSELRQSRDVVLVVCDSLSRKDFVIWVSDRASQNQIQLDNEAIERLVDYCDGNLLAAMQELDVLALITEPGLQLGVNDLQLSDTSTAGVFNLLDEACRGNVPETIKLYDAITRSAKGRSNAVFGVVNQLSSQLASTLESYSNSSNQIPRYQQVRASNLKRRLSHRRIGELLVECAQINSILLGMARGDQLDLVKGLLLAVAGTGHSKLEQDYQWRMIDRAH